MLRRRRFRVPDVPLDEGELRGSEAARQEPSLTPMKIVVDDDPSHRGLREKPGGQMAADEAGTAAQKRIRGWHSFVGVSHLGIF